MPDSLPVIDRSPGYPSALLAFGHGHLGFTLAPATGHLIAELLAEHEPSIDLSPYSALRWSSPGQTRVKRAGANRAERISRVCHSALHARRGLTGAPGGLTDMGTPGS